MVHLLSMLMLFLPLKLTVFVRIQNAEYINAVFAPHIDCVRSYSKRLQENRDHISYVYYVSR